MVHALHRADPARSVRPKSTLYCTECDHESHVRGDWTLRSRGDRLVVECPVCGTAIADRPATPNAPALPRPGPRAASAWVRFVATSTAVWRKTLAIGTASASTLARGHS